MLFWILGKLNAENFEVFPIGKHVGVDSVTADQMCCPYVNQKKVENKILFFTSYSRLEPLCKRL